MGSRDCTHRRVSLRHLQENRRRDQLRANVLPPRDTYDIILPVAPQYLWLLNQGLPSRYPYFKDTYLSLWKDLHYES